MVKNELKDSQMKEETADEDAERRTAATWCGSKDADWWMAAMTALASMASMVSMASIAWKASMASMGPMTAQNRESLTRKTVLSASEAFTDTRWDIKTIISLSSICWDRATDGPRSLRRVDKIDGERVEGLSTIGWLRLAPMASIASMVVWMAQGGIDVEVSLVLLVVASSGVEWWRRWLAGVFDAEGTDVEVLLCLQR